ncbi:chemotaxis protein CheD [Quatrionicoccus australiensis]|uniref:chemotaxis protein CheD n=1 Tax=Quatrionicoccus australiensis TaxID=138118 RepID=UPI001CF95E44|nr:chemotaxis protein CheD [Quatrionicoccus australiensis]MCB4360570.1 chemotaxis protein CheD [Quatrionicoccus australiensis]
MRKPDGVIEIFLQPGEHYFGDRYTRLRTVLGSCVSLVFWHPQELVGSMCHFMLPSRGCRSGSGPDGRYADEALQMMLDEIRASGLNPTAFRLRIFGGGNMFPELTRRNDRHIGQKNVEAALALLKNHCLTCVASHVEGYGHRNLLFDVWSGHVHLRHSTIVPEKNKLSGNKACQQSR